MASGIYNRFKEALYRKWIDLTADSIRVMLLNNSHSFLGTDLNTGNINANEASGTGYTAGGQFLHGLSVSSGPYAAFDANDLTWASSTVGAYHAVIYDASLAGNQLVGSIDFGSLKSSSSGSFTIQWHASGIITLI